MALPTKEEIVRRKKVMRDAGIPTPNIDETWGPWWENRWQNIITHPIEDKYYGEVTFTNFLHQLWDKAVGNKTFKAEPLPIGGTIQATDMSIKAQIGRTLRRWKHEGDPVRDIILFAMPSPDKPIKLGKVVGTIAKGIGNEAVKLFTGQVTKEAAKEAIKEGVKKTIKFVPEAVTSYVAGQAVDKASKTITGKSWADNASKKMSDIVGFQIEPVFGEMTNPGYYLGQPIVNGGKYVIMNQNYSIPFLTNNQTLRKGFRKVLNGFGLGDGFQNIRYRDGIRDYLGNVVSKYSTIVPKPVVYSGNQLELARKRVLDNLEKYGIRDTDYVSWTTFSDDPNLIQLSKSIGFEIPSYNKTPYGLNKVKITMPARTYLEHISPISGTEASFKPMSATIFHQNDGYVGDIQKLYPEFADAHEFSHAIDWVLHNKTTTLPKTSGIHIESDNSALKDLYNVLNPEYKINLSKVTLPEVNVPGLNYNRIKQDIDTQSYLHRPTELKARYEQIKNWLGITDERPLTLTEWNQAKRYYTSSVGDNNMQEFFKLVENPEEFINWANKRYYTNFDGTVSRASIERLSRADTPYFGSYYYPYKVSHEDEAPGFLDLILEQSEGKAPIPKTTGLTSYAMFKPKYQLNPSERPEVFKDLKTVMWKKDPNSITVGDQAYSLAHNLKGWNRLTYRGIVKNRPYKGTVKNNGHEFDPEEAARALMYDVKAQLYKKLYQQNGKPLNADEFADALWDLNKSDFQNAIKSAHDGYYVKENLLTFDVNKLTLDDISKIINILTKYKNGGKFYQKGIRFNKQS